MTTLRITIASILACACMLADDLHFTNASPILIPDAGPATPFVSTVTVSNQTGGVRIASVELLGISHTWLEDLSVMIVGPDGSAVMLASGAGRDVRVDGLSIFFTDNNPRPLPVAGQPDGFYYHPTDYQPGLCTNLPTTYSTNLSTFLSADPNGIWKLLVFDNAIEDQGQINGWVLNLTTAPRPEPLTNLRIVKK